MQTRRLGELEVVMATEDRTSWRFPYRAHDLAGASARQASWHYQRWAHYAAEADAAEAALRDHGITLDERQVTGGAQITATVDVELSRTMADARSRRDRHALAERKFLAYAAVFTSEQASGADPVHHLSVEDVDYFALHREPGD